jgi:hypothetical protein
MEDYAAAHACLTRLCLYKPVGRLDHAFAFVGDGGHVHALHPSLGCVTYTCYRPDNLEPLWSSVATSAWPLPIFNLVFQFVGIPTAVWRGEACVTCVERKLSPHRGHPYLEVAKTTCRTVAARASAFFTDNPDLRQE